MQPVSDPQPGLEWLLVVEGQTPTAGLIHDIATTEVIGGPHPLYPHLNTWVVSKAAVISPDARERLAARIAERRWEEETRGVTVDLGQGRTVDVATDNTSQSKLTGLLVVASGRPINLGWKGQNGRFVAIDNQDVGVMATAVFSHVQSCFAREAELLAGLEHTQNLPAFEAAVEAFW